MKVIDIDIKNVNQFSSRDTDYLTDSKKFKDFLSFDFDYTQFKDVIKRRSTFPTNRSLLKEVIDEQYSEYKSSDKTQSLINSISEANTFTVTTAHQPSLLTGPLYVPFKILSTIKTCNRLREDFPDYNFVPVFITGGEDHDFDEINHLHLYGKKVEWHSEHQGSVGTFPMTGVQEAIEEVQGILGDRSQAKDLINEILNISNVSKNYGDFSIRTIHALFDSLGLMIINMDSKKLKAAFTDIIKKEIIEKFSHPIVKQTQQEIEDIGYSAQTHIRDINFFYKKGELRNRIEHEGDNYKVVDTDITFSEKEIIEEIDLHPDRFSPNVIMRPLYQELILPNLAYIGGGGELAYWMERKAQFESVGLIFPMLIRRSSGMIVTDSSESQIQKVNLTISDLFIQKQDLINRYLNISDAPDYSLDEYKKEIEAIYEKAHKRIVGIDKSLGKTTMAEKVKATKSIDYLESKLKKYVKQLEENNLKKITKLTDKFFPSNGLQERYDNILEYLSLYGTGLIDKISEHCDPFDKTFKVFIMQPEDR